MDSILKSIPNTQMFIQAATLRDLNALRKLEAVCFPKDAWPLIDLIGALTLPNVLRLKAVDEGKMVGFLAADLRPGQDLAWIATIGVLPEHRRRRGGAGAAAGLRGAGARDDHPAERARV